MPYKPKELGTLAKSVTQSIYELLDESDYDFITLQRLVSEKKWDEIVVYVETLAIRNKISVKALQLMLQNKFHAGEKFLLDKDNRSNGNHE